MHRFVSVLAGTLLLAGSLLAGPQRPQETPGIYCKLTRQKIEKCCCEQRDSKLYCTLAKKTIDKCCCKPPQVQRGKKS